MAPIIVKFCMMVHMCPGCVFSRSGLVAPRGDHYKPKYVAFLSISAISSVTNTKPLMRGGAAFVYHALSVDTIARIPWECWRHITSSSYGPDTCWQSWFLYTIGLHCCHTSTGATMLHSFSSAHPRYGESVSCWRTCSELHFYLVIGISTTYNLSAFVWPFIHTYIKFVVFVWNY